MSFVPLLKNLDLPPAVQREALAAIAADFGGNELEFLMTAWSKTKDDTHLTLKEKIEEGVLQFLFERHFSCLTQGARA